MFYVAIKLDGDVKYIYTFTEPELNGYIIYNGHAVKVLGYMNCNDFR